MEFTPVKRESSYEKKRDRKEYVNYWKHVA